MKRLIASIILFIMVCGLSLYLVLNKGHIGDMALLKYDDDTTQEEKITSQPTLSIEFDKEYLSVVSKEKLKPIVYLDDEVVTDGYIIESSDEDVITVNKDNQVVAVAHGKSTITVEYDGLTAQTDLRVITPIKSMSFTTTNSVVRIDKDLQMKLQLSPSDASRETLEYESSDEDIAVVDNAGIVTGVSEGRVTITVRDVYTGMERSVNLSIRK